MMARVLPPFLIAFTALMTYAIFLQLRINDVIAR